MEFIISRTSVWDGQPHKRAHKRTLTHLDRRTWNTLEEAGADKWGREFLASGKNHRAEDGGVVRDIPCEEWVIEIDGIDGLLQLFREEGQLILQESDCKEIPLGLEIYDDYRE